MTTENTRELLELAVKATGRNLSDFPASIVDWRWRPDKDDGDSARMRSALGIGTNWYFADTDDGSEEMYCVSCQRGIHSATEVISNNDRNAALRLCALRVAAAIGRAK